MSELRAPLRLMLRDPAEEGRQEDLCRRALARRRAAASTSRRPWRLKALTLAAALAALLLGAGLWLLRGDQVAAPGVGQVRLAGGERLGAVAVPSDGDVLRLRLSDGSRVELSPGARLEPRVNTDRAVTLRLLQGAADFDINPGGPRAWSVEAGAVTVRVVATQFRVEREGEHLSVGVTRGVVTVAGAQVPGGTRRLVAGESLELGPEVALAPAPVEAVVDAGAGVDAAGPGVDGEAGPPSSALRPARPRQGWRELARAGQFEGAFEELGPTGLARETRRAATMEELLTLADVARRSGHPREAVVPLERGLQLHPGDRRAPVAAFTLGRLHLHSLGDPAAAARAFERCIALGAPSALREDAYARLAQARARSGDRAGARQAAASYLRLFPEGRWAEEARLLSGTP